MTYDEYLRIPDDGRRHEFLGGRHYVHPSPPLSHQIAVGNILFHMHQYVRTSRAGRVYAPWCHAALANDAIVQPDVLFVTARRAHIISARGIEQPPDLIVEVLSDVTRSYDQEVKFAAYQTFGVTEYWIVDPDDQTVKIHRHNGRVFEQAAVTDPITSPLLPGFELSLEDIFAMPS